MFAHRLAHALSASYGEPVSLRSNLIPQPRFCSFLPVSDHLMFRWQQKPSPISKGKSRSFWFLRIILQQERGGKSWALSCQPALTEPSADSTSVTQREPWKLLLQTPKIIRLPTRKWNSPFPFLPFPFLRKAPVPWFKKQSSKRDFKKTLPHKSRYQIWG